MSDTKPQVDVRLERAPEIDDGALLRIRQIRPVEKAASPIIDHNLDLIDTAIALRPWYLGQVKRTPHELMSTLLDPNANNAANMLTAFVETVKRFKPGAFPGHCDAVRKLEFTTVQLIRTLMTLIDSPVLVDAVKRVGALSATLADPSNYLLPDHDLRQRIDSRLRQMLESFGEISNAVHARERERDFEIVFRKLPPEPATKEDVKAIVKRAKVEIKSTVKRATEGADSGCHHRKKDRDALVQQVINYLAQPGITFSIHNACRKVCDKTRKDDFIWLYDWCHRHEQKIHDAVDALRAR